MPYVDAEVYVSLDDFYTEDIVDYLGEKGYTVISSKSYSEPGEALRLIWEAMYLGKPYDEMVRKFVSDQTGLFL